MIEVNFDIEKGSVGDKIAGYTSIALQATSEANLRGAVNAAQGAVNQTINTAEQVAENVASQVIDMMADSEAFQEMQQNLEFTNNTVQVAKTALRIANTGATIAGNVAKAATQLYAMSQVDTTCIPTVKDSVTIIGASIKQRILAIYEQAKALLFEQFNALICVSSDSTLMNVLFSISNIIEQIEPLIEPLIYEKTGYSISEIRHLCVKGFTYIEMYRRVKEARRRENGDYGDDKKSNKTKKSKGEKKAWDKLTQDKTPEQTKEKLLEWIRGQSIILQNAFHLILIKDTIEDIKEFTQLCQNESIDNRAKLVNGIQDLYEIFNELGFTPDAQGITMEDLQQIGVAAVGTVANAQFSIGKQLEKNISNAANSAKDSAINSVKNNAEAAAEAAQNSVENSIQNTQNKLDAMQNSPSENPGNSSTNIEGQPQQNTQESYEPFVADIQNNFGKKEVIVNITMYISPDATTDYLTYLDMTFVNNGKPIFSNGAKRSIINKLTNAWDKDKSTNFTINGKVDKIIRKYKFNVTVDKAKYQEQIQKVQNAKYGSMQTAGPNVIVDFADNTVTDLSVIGEDAVKQMTNLNIHLDMSEIERILHGKVLMFDTVVQILKIFQPIVQILGILCHLLENYEINKEYVRSGAMIDLSFALKNAARTVMGLKDIINLKDTNFFTVRTKQMAEWCKSEFGVQPDNAGFATINILQTTVLNTYCALHAIRLEIPLILIKGTTLYFDQYGITNGGATDGCLLGIDNMSYNAEADELYYDSKNRTTQPSQINRAKNRGEDPLYSPKKRQQAQEDELQALMQNITIESDEFEGQQALNLQEMKLCEPVQQLITDNTNADDSSKGIAIVEFGTEHTNGEEVEYVLSVKPGQTINDKTILATIITGGQTKQVRSIFSKGTIKSINNDYYHVYPQSCDRHIIIEDYEMGQGIDYDANDVSIMTKKFGDSGELYSLITNNMCYSLLPTIMSNNVSSAISTPSPYTVYDKAIDKFYDIIDNTKNKLDPDKLTSELSGASTDPTVSEKVGDSMLIIREELYNDIVKHYNESCESTCALNKDFSECACLAFGNSNLKNVKIGQSTYDNYYFNLLANINTQSNNEWSIKYYNLLKDIINNRAQSENYDLPSIIQSFNKLFSDNIYECDNAYEMFNQDLKKTLANKKNNANKNVSTGEYIEGYTPIKEDEIDVTFTTVNEYIKELVSTRQAKGQNIKDNKGELIVDTTGIVSQLTNMYVYMLENKDNFRTTTVKIGEKSLQTIIKELNKYINNTIGDNFKIDITSGFANVALTTYKNLQAIKNDANDKTIIAEDGPGENTVRYYFQSWLSDNVSINVSSEILDNVYHIIADLYEQNKNSDEQIKYSDQTNNTIFSYTRDLVKIESEKLKVFWQSAISTYDTQLNIRKLIGELKDYANNATKYAAWPQVDVINISGKTYDLYTFTHRNMPSKDFNMKDTPLPSNMEEVSTDIPEATIDYTDIRDILGPDDKTISIKDYPYWLIWFANATLLTLIPLYWADGFDIPTPAGPVPLPLPGIYFPIAPPVTVPFVNVTIVFGLAIRGIWIFPIVLMINLNSHDINALLPLQVILEMTKFVFDKTVTAIENGIPAIIDGMLNNMINNNADLKKKLDKFKTYASLIQNSIPIEDKALITSEFKKALHPEADNREVLTRTDKLDNGPEPF